MTESAPLPMARPLLRVEGLRTHFHTRDGVVRAVDGVGFDVHAGETLAIVGESSCGKSVTSMSILRLLPMPPARIVSGRIEFDGRNLLDLTEPEMRQVRGNAISMIFQVLRLGVRTFAARGGCRPADGSQG